METQLVYKSFNSNKTIEELQYNILKDITQFENLKLELEFYKYLIEKPVFKTHIMNLYERLVSFKNEIKMINETLIDLLNEIYAHAKHIENKIECEDLTCDNFFIKEHDDIELKIFNFHITISDFKLTIFANPFPSNWINIFFSSIKKLNLSHKLSNDSSSDVAEFLYGPLSFFIFFLIKIFFFEDHRLFFFMTKEFMNISS